MKSYNSQNSAAFTLIELVISISVFMLFLSIAAGAYTSLVSANRRANEMQNMYREVRFAFDSISQDIRGGVPDYSCIDTTRLDVECLENQNQNLKVIAIMSKTALARTLYKFDATAKKLLALRQTRPAKDQTWTGSNWQPLTSETLPLEDVSFSAFPAKDPYASANFSLDAIQWQPTIGIKLTARGLHFQTTYTSRTYGK
ncbi:MAG: type II secretion system protein [Patescibacteria group bacterium]